MSKKSKDKDLNILTVKEMVIRILDQYPESRYNDMILAVKIYDHFFHIRSIFELLKTGIPQHETIRRERQRIQAEGLYCRGGNRHDK